MDRVVVERVQMLGGGHERKFGAQSNYHPKRRFDMTEEMNDE